MEFFSNFNVKSMYVEITKEFHYDNYDKVMSGPPRIQGEFETRIWLENFRKKLKIFY